MPDITDAELAEWERLEREATPGPWEFADLLECQLSHHVRQLKLGGRTYTIANAVHVNPQTERNMRFIAAARSVLPRLLAEVRRLRGER